MRRVNVGRILWRISPVIFAGIFLLVSISLVPAQKKKKDKDKGATTSQSTEVRSKPANQKPPKQPKAVRNNNVNQTGSTQDRNNDRNRNKRQNPNNVSNEIFGTKPGKKDKTGRGNPNTYTTERDRAHRSNMSQPSGLKGPTRGKGGSGNLAGAKVFRTRSGSEVHYGANGRVREVHFSRGMTIYHGPGGARRIIVERPNHSRIVVYGRRFGYVQRPFAWRGHEFVSRTYIFRGRPYAFYYRGYPYRGVYLHGYLPYRYYRPAFYGWAYNPWRRPVYYRWGWAGSPWYGYYGYYFRPYPVYPGASFWLTDFLISTSLEQAYLAGVNSQAGGPYSSFDSGGGPVLTDDIKQEIADEVRNQIALENSESRTAETGDLDIDSSGIPRILADVAAGHPHTFLVHGPLDLTDSSGDQCSLSAGDVLRLSSPTDPNATAVPMEVLASKSQECPGGETVFVPLAELQEMQNSMRAGIDQGLGDLQAHQGGLPAPPASAAAPPVNSSFAPIAPPPDPNATSDLDQEAQRADTEERGALDEARQSGGSTPAAQIDVGQTVDEVVAALGQPKTIARSGSRQIYVYENLKVTFLNGKVIDIE